MDGSRNRSSLVLGTLLIAAGVLFFAVQYFGFENWGNLWPLIIVGVGAAFFVGMIAGGRQMGGLAIPGSIIITVGLILLFQNTFNYFESWSYAWALIVAAVGIGLIIHGKWSGLPDQVRGGMETLQIGLILFVVFGALMEFIFGMTGVSDNRSTLLFPILLTVVGLLMLIARIAGIAQRREDGRSAPNLFWPVLFAGLGLLWTLTALKLLPIEQVSALLNLWPLLLIAAGLDLALGRRSPWTGLVLGVLLVGAIFALVIAGPRLGIDLSPAWMSGSFTGAGIVRERVSGSGTITSEERAVRGFSGIDLSAGGRAEVVVGDAEGIQITGDENLLPYIETEVRGGILYIGVRRGVAISPSQRIEYIIQVRDLNRLSVSGAGEVLLNELSTDRLEVNTSGEGRFELHKLTLEELLIDVSGSGSVAADGETGRLSLNISGSGQLEAANLQTQEADVEISGSGQAVVWVLERLEANISGAGQVAYYGSPTVSKDVSGSGTVNSLGEK